MKGVTKDISWGGALLSLARPLPADTRVVRVVLPWKRDVRITAMAQVMRSKRLQDARTLVAVRFLSLSPRSNLRLERLLETLSASTRDFDPGESSGFVKELEVSVNDVEELRGMMETVAGGRYTCTVFEAYARDQSLCFVLAGTEEWTGIRLRARAVEVKPTTLSGYVDVPLYDVTLQFEHPKDSLAKLIDYILGQLPESGDTTMMLGWSQMGHSTLFRSKPKPKPESSKPPPPLSKRPVKAVVRSALETDFPEALNYLMLGWGDSEAFAMMFRELTIGERFQIGGWPPEAWEELLLLQDVHDRAYGLTGERDTFRRFGT